MQHSRWAVNPSGLKSFPRNQLNTKDEAAQKSGFFMLKSRRLRTIRRSPQHRHRPQSSVRGNDGI
jgi:hypothetical protein